MSFRIKNSAVWVFSLVFLCAGCQSSKQETVVAHNLSDTYQSQEGIPKDSVTISVSRKKGSYFSSIDSQVYNDVCIGSPTSLRRAASAVRKAVIDYTENEQVLYNIISSIFTIVWKSEQNVENVPPLKVKNYYTQIIDEASKGYFDRSAAESSSQDDFLSVLLPCLCILNDSVRADEYPFIEQNLNAALRLQPKSVLALYLKGMLYFKQGIYDKAAEVFDKSFSDGQIIYEVQLAKAQCLLTQKKYEQVQDVLSNLVVQYPSDIRILKLYASVAFLTGNYQDAERYALMVLQQNPSDLEFVLFRAKVFVTTGEYLKASGLLDVYAKTNPDAKEYLLLRAKVQKEWNKNLASAFATVEKALARYPQDPEVIIYAASIASDTGGKIGGKTGGQLAGIILEREPENQEALRVAANSYYREGFYPQAYSYSTKLLSVSSGSKDIIVQHIKICLALKNTEEAWKYASSLYERNGQDMDTVQIYIEVMIASGRTGTASRLINQLLPQASSVMKSFLYYQRSFLAPSETAGLGDLRSSLIANPRNSDALLRMYRIYYNKKDYRKAQYYLKQVVALNPNEDKYLKLNAELDSLIR